MPFIKTWDESTPSGGEDVSQGDDRIREFKYAIRERMAVDHYFLDNEAGDSKIGYHKTVTLLDQSTPVQVANAIRVYSKEVSSSSELHSLNELGTEQQLTLDQKLWMSALRIASQAQGDIPYFNGSIWTRRAIGTDGDLLKVNAGVPEWFTPAYLTEVPSGSVVGSAFVQSGTMATGSTTIPSDNTIPQNTEGTEFMTLAFTPTNASNKLRITTTFIGTLNADDYVAVCLFQDSTAGALAVARARGPHQITTTFTHEMVAGTTSPTTFKIRAGAPNGTVTFNGDGGNALYGGVLASSMKIEEIKA